MYDLYCSRFKFLLSINRENVAKAAGLVAAAPAAIVVAASVAAAGFIKREVGVVLPLLPPPPPPQLILITYSPICYSSFSVISTVMPTILPLS